MKRLDSSEILELHRIASADKRLNRLDRVVLCTVAREGHTHAKSLATSCGLKTPEAAAKRVAKLRELRYLPPVEAKR